MIEIQFALWKILSFAWVEIEITEDEYDQLSQLVWADQTELRAIIYRDVLGDFALPSFCMLFVWIPTVDGTAFD